MRRGGCSSVPNRLVSTMTHAMLSVISSESRSISEENTVIINSGSAEDVLRLMQCSLITKLISKPAALAATLATAAVSSPGTWVARVHTYTHTHTHKHILTSKYLYVFCGWNNIRVESFIEHQDTCNRSGRHAPSTQIFLPIRTTQPPAPTPRHNVELQLLPSSNSVPTTQSTIYEDGPEFTQLHLSIGHKDPTTGSRLENSKEKMELALAIEARKKVERNVKMAEEEFSNAKRLRKQAQMELNKAVLMREHALNQIKSMMLEITCHSCQKQQQRQQDQQHQQKFL